MTTKTDTKYMMMAISLARRGVGSVEPNPAVGCVIVKDGVVIGRGWHKKFGFPHAEINAIEDCKKRGNSPAGASLYVTLEPCCHFGKTPPCTDAITAAGISKVFAAAIDPSSHANGKGIRKLRAAGIEVAIGPCETQARLLNAPFFKFAKTGRPWVILKWAQSMDGKLAWKNRAAADKWISNELSRKDAHKLRRRVGAILVGIDTVIADDPLLTGRPAKGRKPARIVLDTNLRIPLDCRVLATAKQTPVLIVAGREAVRRKQRKSKVLTEKNVEVLAVPARSGRCDLNFLLDRLGKRGISRLLVEGGPTVIASFLKQGLADELVVYIAPKTLGSAGAAELDPAIARLTQPAALGYVKVHSFADDVRITGFSKKTLRKLSISKG